MAQRRRRRTLEALLDMDSHENDVYGVEDGDELSGGVGICDRGFLEHQMATEIKREMREMKRMELQVVQVGEMMGVGGIFIK